MDIKVQISIKSSKEKIWNIITDIENTASTISAINKIEILKRPSSNTMIGLKWRETRILFGKSATETMWITDSVRNEYYTTRAESHGSIYKSKLSLTEKGDATILTMEFEGEAETSLAKIMSFLMGFMFKGATKRAMQQDLNDIKSAAENPPTSAINPGDGKAQ